MKLLNSKFNSKFNIGDVLKINENAESWYEKTFTQSNVAVSELVKKLCRDRFIVYNVVRYLRSGITHLYIQKQSELKVNPNPNCIVFILDKNGLCINETLFWSKFNEPLFVRDKE